MPIRDVPDKRVNKQDKCFQQKVMLNFRGFYKFFDHYRNDIDISSRPLNDAVVDVKQNIKFSLFIFGRFKSNGYLNLYILE